MRRTYFRAATATAAAPVCQEQPRSHGVAMVDWKETRQLTKIGACKHASTITVLRCQHHLAEICPPVCFKSSCSSVR